MLCIFLQTINNEEDQKAFEELYKKYSKNLLTYAIGKLGRSGNFQDAEDAVSQTFCRIIMALPPPKGDEVDSKEIKNYLYATLAGICLDKLEKKNKEKSVMFLTDEIQKFRQSLDELADSVIDKLTLDEVIEVIEKLQKVENAVYAALCSRFDLQTNRSSDEHKGTNGTSEDLPNSKNHCRGFERGDF